MSANDSGEAVTVSQSPDTEPVRPATEGKSDEDIEQVKQSNNEEETPCQEPEKQTHADEQVETSLEACCENVSVSSTDKPDELSGAIEVRLPVIPLPPDESAQDSSDVVMGTTTKHIVTETPSSDDSSADAVKSAAGGSVDSAASHFSMSAAAAQFTVPHTPHTPAETPADDKCLQNSKAQEELPKPHSHDSDSEITFKIPQLLSGSITTTKETCKDTESKEPKTFFAQPLDASASPLISVEEADSKSETGDSVHATDEVICTVDKCQPSESSAVQSSSDQNTTASDEKSVPQEDEPSPVDAHDAVQAEEKPSPEHHEHAETNESMNTDLAAAESVPVTECETMETAGGDAGDDAEMTADAEVETKDEESGAGDGRSVSNKRRNSSGSAADASSMAAETEDTNDAPHHLSADQLFEYQWPPDKTGEYYFLQEQISEYLMVKSFKRKYPDLQRRPVEVQERMFLREKGIVTETQCDLGLTAVRSEELYDLMLKDYPDKYQDYVQVLQEKERRTISDKHKEYGMPRVDKGKMKEYMKKAIKSAAEFNLHFMRELKEERKAYFDLQTFQVMYPQGQMKKMPPELTKVSAYPVALIPGQFQEHYKMYNPQELNYFPLNTALYDPPKSLKNIYAKPKQEGESDSEESVTSGASLESVHTSSSGSSQQSSASSSNDQDEDSSPCCHICSGGPEKNISGDAEELVACSECARSGHPSCLEITEEMIPIIKTYSWQCMECKTCVECMDPYDEDKMMFCDHCDRGYHTFCVGLRSIPTGRWECPSCRPDEPKPKQRRTRTR